MLRAVFALALTGPLVGCATTQSALSVAACGVADERLGTIVRDPGAVIEYFKAVGAEGKRIVAAAKAGEPAGDDAVAWISDQLDLIERMNKCVPRE